MKPQCRHPASPHIIPPSQPALPLSFQCWPPHPSAGPGQPPAKADVPTSSLSSSLKRQAIHYDPSLPSVYSVPIYHRCVDGMSSVNTECSKSTCFLLKEQHEAKQQACRESAESLLFNDTKKKQVFPLLNEAFLSSCLVTL